MSAERVWACWCVWGGVRWGGCSSGAAGVPTPHSLALCFMAGPLGLLSHLATKALARALFKRRGGGGSRDEGYVVYRF